MNIIDIAVIGLLAISVAAGYYRGFLVSLADLGAALLSNVVALIGYPLMASSIKQAGKLIPTLMGFSESADMIGSIEVYRTPVTSLDPTAIAQLVERLNLPHPLSSLYLHNLAGAVYAPSGLVSIGDYLSMSMAEMAINILSYVVVFAVTLILLMFIIHTGNYAARFPSLKVCDGLSGATIGLLRGVVVFFVLFMSIPVLLAFMPFQELQYMIDSSLLAQFFYKSNFLLGWISSSIR